MGLKSKVPPSGGAPKVCSPPDNLQPIILGSRCSLGVAKQLGPIGQEEERQARAGALSALACVMLRGTSEVEVSSREGGLGGKERGKERQDWPKKMHNNGQLLHSLDLSCISRS